MFADSFSFPHPVLGLNDDIQGEFTISIKVERNVQERKLRFYNFEYLIDNKYINELINKNKAGILIKIYCSSTFLTWTILDPQKNFELDENDLFNKIEINVFIVTKERIENYSHSSFNPQFEGFNFSLNENEIIGLTGKTTMGIEKTDEKLGLGNIFKFFSHDTEKPIEFSYNHDKIHIIYPKEGENHPPNALFKSHPWAAYNIFIVPALQGAFQFAQDEPSDAEGLEWYTLLTNIIPQDQWGLSDNYSNAQKFLKGKLPVIKAFTELSK